MKKHSKNLIKLICLSLAFVMMLTVALTACGTNDEGETDTESESVADTSESEETTEEEKEPDEDNKEGDDNPSEEPKLDVIALTYGKYGIGAATKNDGSVYTVDDETGIVTISHASSGAWSSTRYMLKAKFPQKELLTAKYRYMRVVYAAVNPEGSGAVDFMLRNDATGSADDLVLATIEQDTDSYKLTPVATLNVGLLQRFMDANHNSFFFKTAAEGGTYYIKGIYFFSTQTDAEAFTVEYADKMAEEAKKAAEEDAKDGPTVAMTFGTDGNAITDRKEGTEHFGKFSGEINASGEVEINYSSVKNYSTTRYIAVPEFKAQNSLTTKYRYVRVLYSATNPTGVSSVEMILRDIPTGSANDVVLNTAVQNTTGYSLTKTANINTTMLTSFILCKDVGVIFNTNTEGGQYKIKAIYFFTSEESANAFTVEGAVDDTTPTLPDNPTQQYMALTFGATGSALLTNNAASNYTADTETPSVKISYSTTQQWASTRYILKPKFAKADASIADYKYVRIVYSAKNPEGATGVDLMIRNDAAGGEDDTVFAAGVSDTAGFVMTDTVELNENLMSRFAAANHNSIFFKTSVEGGEYHIYGIYFFKTQAEANAFTSPAGQA